MTNNTVYKIKAENFYKIYKVKEINSSCLQDILAEQGYKVILLNRIENHDAVEALLKEIGCESFAKSSKAFTYKKGQNKIVFIDGNLQEIDKLHALAHEEGHIFCGHMERETCSLSNVEDEWEANEFAHYILNRTFKGRVSAFYQRHKKLTITVICIAVLLAVCIPVLSGIQGVVKQGQGYVKTLDYYVTETGTKYHTKDCTYLNRSSSVRRITEEEYQNKVYEPCKECIK